MNGKKTKTILIVEDDPDSAEFAQFTLEHAGYETILAPDGATALEFAFNGQDIDLVLLDIMLPDMDGYSICSKLKIDPKTEHLPVVMLTAKTSESDVMYGIAMAEADAYLKKPTGPESLLETVLSLLTS